MTVAFAIYNALMNLRDYFATDAAMSAAELGRRIGVTNPSQVRQWQHRYQGRIPSPENCVAIERVTGGLVSRRDLRPDDWHRIWPELAESAQPHHAARQLDAVAGDVPEKAQA